MTKHLAKLNRVVDKLQTHAELTKKNDLLKVEGETPKLNEQKLREPSANGANHSQKQNTANEIETRKHTLIR